MDGRPSRGKDARLTLIVSCLTASQAIQVSDRRDTFGGEYSDYAHKALFFCGHVSLANMGLARIGELDSLEWLAHQLYKCADIHEVMERIPDRLTAEVGRGKDAGAQLGFLGVGWAQPPGSRADAELAPLFCSISNFQTSLREFTAQPTDDFRALEHVVEHPPFVHIAWGRETEQRELEEAVRALPDLDDPGAIAGPLVDYAKHHAAERAMVDPPGIVSQAFLVTSLPRIGAGGEPSVVSRSISQPELWGSGGISGHPFISVAPQTRCTRLNHGLRVRTVLSSSLRPGHIQRSRKPRLSSSACGRESTKRSRQKRAKTGLVNPPRMPVARTWPERWQTTPSSEGLSKPPAGPQQQEPCRESRPYAACRAPTLSAMSGFASRRSPVRSRYAP
jgi:hypothetical protein